MASKSANSDTDYFFNGLKGSLKPTHEVILRISCTNQGSDINVINTVDVETVEVLRFASASMYGIRSGGGVLIITKKRRWHHCS